MSDLIERMRAEAEHGQCTEELMTAAADQITALTAQIATLAAERNAAGREARTLRNYGVTAQEQITALTARLEAAEARLAVDDAMVDRARTQWLAFSGDTNSKEHWVSVLTAALEPKP